MKNEEKIEPKQKEQHHKDTLELKKHLGLKNMHEGSPRQVLKAINKEYINLWGS